MGTRSGSFDPGAKIDQKENLKNSTCINSSDGKLSIHVIPTDEELMIATNVLRYLTSHQIYFTRKHNFN